MFFTLKNKCKHLELQPIDSKLIKIGNKTVFKNNNQTLYEYSWIKRI